MSYVSYTRLYFTLLCVGLVLLTVGVVLAVASPQQSEALKDGLLSAGAAGLGLAFLADATCGLHHGKFKIEGSHTDDKATRGIWFWMDVSLVYCLGVTLLSVAVRLWASVAR